MKPSGNIPPWRQKLRKVCIAPFLALIWFYRTCIVIGQFTAFPVGFHCSIWILGRGYRL